MKLHCNCSVYICINTPQTLPLYTCAGRDRRHDIDDNVYLPDTQNQRRDSHKESRVSMHTHTCIYIYIQHTVCVYIYTDTVYYIYKSVYIFASAWSKHTKSLCKASGEARTISPPWNRLSMTGPSALATSGCEESRCHRPFLQDFQSSREMEPWLAFSCYETFASWRQADFSFSRCDSGELWCLKVFSALCLLLVLLLSKCTLSQMSHQKLHSNTFFLLWKTYLCSGTNIWCSSDEVMLHMTTAKYAWKLRLLDLPGPSPSFLGECR